MTPEPAAPAPLEPAPPPTDSDAEFRQILSLIIKRFIQAVNAPTALRIARAVPELVVDDEGNVLAYNQADPLLSVTLLVDQFRQVFGEAGARLAQQTAGLAARPAERGGTPATRILIVDDHSLFRQGLASFIDGQAELRVVGQVGSVAEALTSARELRPDLVLMDFVLADGTGVAAMQAILAELPTIKFVFLTAYDDDDRLFAAIRAGAIGYLYKNVHPLELLQMLLSVSRGEVGISGGIARRILIEFSRLTSRPAAEPQTPVAELTPRELEIVHELARGASNQEIAQSLVISESTVKKHIGHILDKLHLNSRYAVADYARTHRLQ